MRLRSASIVPVPPWGMAITAILSIQLGSALSVGMIEEIGPAGTGWLRLSMGAVILLLIARPPLRAVRRGDVLPLLGLGVMTGVMSIGFLAAIAHIPLGTAVAIEFLGPLTVAAARSHDRKALLWPGLALLGVILLTEPWQGDFNPTGVAWAALAGVAWGAYVLLTQRVGDRFTGIGALSITVPIAAVTGAVVGIPQAAGHLTPSILVASAGLAILLPVLPFALEMLALRKMTATAFGTPVGPRASRWCSSRAARPTPAALRGSDAWHCARGPCWCCSAAGRATRPGTEDQPLGS